MIKIKLERWKEVVRVDTKIKGYVDVAVSAQIIVHDDVTYIIFYHECEAVKYIRDIKEAIGKYNNSVKDDGYKWFCDGCAQKCKTAGSFPEEMCMLNVIPPNWQKITNNKIEIVED